MESRYLDRMARAAAGAERAGLTGLLVTPGPDLRYLAGYDPPVLPVDDFEIRFADLLFDERGEDDRLDLGRHGGGNRLLCVADRLRTGDDADVGKNGPAARVFLVRDIDPLLDPRVVLRSQPADQNGFDLRDQVVMHVGPHAGVFKIRVHAGEW
jgi:hypothetical protein